MLYSRIITYVSSTPWALLPEKFAEILAFLRVRASGGEVAEEDVARIVAARPASVDRSVGAIAVLPVMGVLNHRADMLRESSGGMSVERLSAQFRSLIQNSDVAAIVLDVSSPGGSVEGITEFAAQIFEARTQKPVWAIANSQMASAAFWLASSASEIVATPSSEVGSVGVYGAHQDLSKMFEEAGIKTTLISAGKYKVEGSPFEALSDEARAAMQERVNEHYDQFVKDLARGRGVAQKAVREGFGEGRMVGAEQALALGMVDRVESFDAAMARLARKVARAGTKAEAPAAHIHAAIVDESHEPPAGVLATAPDPSADLDLRRRRLKLAEAHRERFDP